MAAKKQKSLVGQYVLVGTDRNVLAAGILTRYDEEAGLATLEPGRQIVYWPRETRGAFGLAARGATAGTRVSAAAPRVELRGVTGVVQTTDAARTSIEAEPWS